MMTMSTLSFVLERASLSVAAAAAATVVDAALAPRFFSPVCGMISLESQEKYHII